MPSQHDLANMWATAVAHPWMSALLLVAFIVLLWVAGLLDSQIRDSIDDAEQRGK